MLSLGLTTDSSGRVHEDVPARALIGYWHLPLPKACSDPKSGFCVGRYVINEYVDPTDVQVKTAWNGETAASGMRWAEASDMGVSIW
jgi:hypothetical protein